MKYSNTGIRSTMVIWALKCSKPLCQLIAYKMQWEAGNLRIALIELYLLIGTL